MKEFIHSDNRKEIADSQWIREKKVKFATKIMDLK